MTICVTGATGFIGAHVARLEAERGSQVRVTYRDEARLGRLGGVEAEPVKADVLDRGALRRAVRRCEVVFHTAGYVGANPRSRVWDVNAVSPRIVGEAAAAGEGGRGGVTPGGGGIGPRAPGGGGGRGGGDPG